MNEWISVKEKLPEDDKPVLVVFDLLESCFRKDRQTIKRRLQDIKRYFEYNPNYYCWEDTKYHKVTHWMPLPEPPKY